MTDDFRIRYDTSADVLYLTTPSFGPAYGEEDEPGVFWRYLDSDGTLVGVTIMDFHSYWRPRLPSLVDQISEHFHIPSIDARRVLASAEAP